MPSNAPGAHVDVIIFGMVRCPAESRLNPLLASWPKPVT